MLASPPSHQLALPRTVGWGGRRAGAGRKKLTGPRRPVPHRARPRHRASEPVHVTLRARTGVPSLRTRALYPAVRNAIANASKDTFAVVHFSVQTDHIHLICESPDRRALSGGLRGLTIRIALAVNRALGRRGQVWGDRYHGRALSSPREVRHALVYVLMNFRKHLPASRPGLDPCSSAAWFEGFRARDRPPAPRDAPPISPARTWLATTGWRQHGLIGLDERPGPSTRARHRASR